MTTVPMNEAQWQQRITDTCDLYGLVWHHETDSRRSKAGFPDLVIVGNSTIFAELKTDRGRVSTAQQFWLDRINEAGGEAVVWRPRDWDRVFLRLLGLSRRPVTYHR